MLPRMWRLLRDMRPAIVHTRNLAALEMKPARRMLAGVPVRIHGEHGWNSQRPRRAKPEVQADPPRLPTLRASVHRAVAPHRALSARPRRRRPRAHGADLQRRRHAALPARRAAARAALRGSPFTSGEHCGWSARWVACRPSRTRCCWRAPSCAHLRSRPRRAQRMRLVMAGEGPLRAEIEARAARVAAWPTGPGSPARATTCPRCCAGSTPSCFPPWPRASPTPCSRPWPARCPSSPPGGRQPRAARRRHDRPAGSIAGRRGPGARAARRLRAPRGCQGARTRGPRASANQRFSLDGHGGGLRRPVRTTAGAGRRARHAQASSRTEDNIHVRHRRHLGFARQARHRAAMRCCA